jgi:hypothetical protein
MGAPASSQKSAGLETLHPVRYWSFFVSQCIMQNDFAYSPADGALSTELSAPREVYGRPRDDIYDLEPKGPCSSCLCGMRELCLEASAAVQLWSSNQGCRRLSFSLSLRNTLNILLDTLLPPCSPCMNGYDMCDLYDGDILATTRGASRSAISMTRRAPAPK